MEFIANKKRRHLFKNFQDHNWCEQLSFHLFKPTFYLCNLMIPGQKLNKRYLHIKISTRKNSLVKTEGLSSLLKEVSQTVKMPQFLEVWFIYFSLTSLFLQWWWLKSSPLTVFTPSEKCCLSDPILSGDIAKEVHQQLRHQYPTEVTSPGEVFCHSGLAVFFLKADPMWTKGAASCLPPVWPESCLMSASCPKSYFARTMCGKYAMTSSLRSSTQNWSNPVHVPFILVVIED